MQIDKKYQIELVASKDEDRETLRYVVIKQTTALATDGVCLAVVPCAVGDGEHIGPITPDSLKYARAHTMGEGCVLMHLNDPEEATCEDTAVFPRCFACHTEGEGDQMEMFRQPETIALPQKDADILFVPKRTPEQVVLTINPKRLFDLAKALGDKDKITLSFTPNDDNIVLSAIRADGYEGAFGAIIPLNSDV